MLRTIFVLAGLLVSLPGWSVAQGVLALPVNVTDSVPTRTTKSYLIPATFGDLLTIRVQRLNVSVAPTACFDVIDTAGQSLRDPSDRCRTSQPLIVRPFRSGTFEIRIYEQGQNHVLEFRLTVGCEGVCSNPPGPDAPPVSLIPRPLNLPADLTGAVAEAGGSQMYQFAGFAGGRITIGLDERIPRTPAMPCATVSGPGIASGGRAFREITQCGDPTALSFDVVLDGDYLIRINESGDNERVHFILQVRCTGVCNAGPLSLTSVTPPRVPVLREEAQLTLSGSGFTLSSRARFNGIALPTTFVNSRELKARFQQTLRVRPGVGTLDVEGGHGQSSNTIVFEVTAPPTNAPAISTVSPGRLMVSDETVRLAVLGAGFVPESSGLWNDTPVATTFVSSGELSLRIDASFVAAPGFAAVSVLNPGNLVAIPVEVRIAPPGLRFDVSSVEEEVFANQTSPPPRDVFVVGPAGTGFTAQIQATTGASASWVRTSASSGQAPSLLRLTFATQGLPEGTYAARVLVRSANNFADEAILPLTVRVRSRGASSLSVDRNIVPLQAPAQSGSTGNQSDSSATIVVKNRSSASVPLSVETRTDSGLPWLNVQGVVGAIGPDAEITLGVLPNTRALHGRTLVDTGEVLIKSGATELRVIVRLSVYEPGTLITTREGLSFDITEDASGYAEVPDFSEGLAVFREPPASLDQFRISSDSRWLNVGDLPESTPLQRLVRVDLSADARTDLRRPALNEKGEKYPKEVTRTLSSAITIESPPDYRKIPVTVRAYPNGTALPVRFTPLGLVFPPSATGGINEVQEIVVLNRGFASAEYRLTVVGDGKELIDIEPASITLPGCQIGQRCASAKLRVRVAAEQQLPVGVTQLTLVAVRTPSGDTTKIPLVLVKRATAQMISTRFSEVKAADCQASRLDPVVTSLPQNFVVTAAAPVSIDAIVADDCGNFREDVSVELSFSNGDPPVRLARRRPGFWHGTWVPNLAARRAELAVRARSSTASGQALRIGEVLQNPGLPQIEPSGVRNAITQDLSGVLAPGLKVIITGKNLSETSETANPIDPPTALGSTRVRIAGALMPLLSVSPTKLDAVVPRDMILPQNATILVESSGVLSAGFPVAVAPARPTLLSRGDGSLALAGFLDLSGAAVETGAPGYTVFLYASGLGDVESLTNGEQRVKQPVSVNIGSFGAEVLKASAMQGYSGIYEIVAVIPRNSERGLQVPVQIGAGGHFSTVLTIPIH